MLSFDTSCLKWFGLILIVGLSAHPCLPQEPLTRARRELDAGQVTPAIRVLIDYRRLHPADPRVYNLLGIAYAREGDIVQSLEMFRRFARLAPDNPQAYNNLGATYLRLGEEEKAERAFRRSLALRPDDVNVLYNLGALLNAMHQYTAARPLLQRAFSHQRSAPIVYELAVAIAGSGDHEVALRLIGSMPPPAGIHRLPWLRLLGTLNLKEGNLEEASRFLGKALELAPNDNGTLYALAVVRLKSRRTAEAISLLDKTMTSVPPSQRCARIADILVHFGATDAAIQEFERAIELDPHSYSAFYNLAILRLGRGKDLPGAFQAAEQALAIRPSAEIHDLLGDICDDEGHFRQALEHYQQAVQMGPDNDRFIFDLGVELILHNNYDVAQTIFQIAEKRFPRSARVALGLGAAEYMEGKRHRAVIAFLDAVNLDSSYRPAYLFLGEAADFAGTHLPLVIAKLSQIARQEPGSFGIQYYYGAALVSRMDHTGNLADAGKALAILRRAASLNPRDPRVYYQMGEIARLQHRDCDALPMYRRAISLDPEFADALYKLAQAYVHQGRKEDAQRLFARQRKVVVEEKQELYHRSGAIESFILQIRNAK